MVLDSLESVREAVDAVRGRTMVRRPTSRTGRARATVNVPPDITMVESACTGGRPGTGQWANIAQVLSGRRP
jgi:hypothetical protein